MNVTANLTTWSLCRRALTASILTCTGNFSLTARTRILSKDCEADWPTDDAHGGSERYSSSKEVSRKLIRIQFIPKEILSLPSSSSDSRHRDKNITDTKGVKRARESIFSQTRER